MKKSRLHYSILNSTISTGIYVLNILIKFISRSIFIRYLGAEILGLNGLLYNILNMLSLAELGIGVSIVFSLYKPLEEENHPQVKGLMTLYKKIYTGIGILIGIIGIALMPFLKNIIGDTTGIEHLYLIYILYLTNSVVSYFFTYNRSLLNANQEGYITIVNDFIFTTLATIFQIIVLILFKSYVGYLAIQIVFTLLGNLSVTYIVNKRFSYLNEVESEKLPKEVTEVLKRNTIGNLSSKIGGVIVNSTDNILISNFVNIRSVGLYSNYVLIISSMQMLFYQITNSITSSIGNVAISKNRQKGLEIFKKHFFINYALAYFSTAGLIVVLDPFIKVWVGEKYLLGKSIVLMIILNCAIRILRNTSIVFIDAYGLAWNQRWKSIVESIVNLAASLFFLKVFDLGILGVLLGTFVSSITIPVWYEPFVFFRDGLHMSVKVHWRFVAKYIIVLLVNSLLLIYIAPYIQGVASGFLGLVIEGLSAILISTVLFVLCFFKTEEFQFLGTVVKKFIKR